MKMKKYTIIYSQVHRRANMSWTKTKFMRLETEDVKKWFDNSEIKDDVNFIFEGWPKQEGEK